MPSHCRNRWSALAALLFAACAQPALASTYYVTITGAPATIACTNTSYTFGFGATFSWSLPSATSVVNGSLAINGTTIGTLGGALGSAAGSYPLFGSNPQPYDSTPFPYTVRYSIVPEDGDTDGVSLSFTCAGAQGSNFRVTRLPGTSASLAATPASVTFPATVVGATSAGTSITVANSGNADATGIGIASSSADFVVTASTCIPTLARNASCSVAVAFAPAAVGARSGEITLTRAGSAVVTIPVSGTGTTQLALAPSLIFGSQPVGTSSAPVSVPVTNVGSTPVIVSSVASDNPAEFVVTTTCTTVAAGSGCSIAISFVPSAAGTRTATITVASNGGGAPQTISVSGTGSASASPGQLVLPAALSFGPQAVGTTSGSSAVSITNAGGSAVTITGITSSNAAEFPVTSNCVALAPAATCTLTAAFAPSAAGARAATITVMSTGLGSPQTVAATGTGSAGPTSGQLSAQAAFNLGSIVLGATGSPTVVIITNVGAAAVLVSAINSSAPSEFAIAAPSCGIVNAGASCTFGIVFTPAALGSRTAVISIVNDGVAAPLMIDASGAGVSAAQATVDLIEYHHAEWDHYFITGIADEIGKLDAGVYPGWTRTGLRIKAYPPTAATTAAVCRFFSTAFAPRSSHFYTPFADECVTVKGNPDWQFEGDVFNMALPAIDGSCPQGTLPVYRLYNDGQGGAPNHRYTADPIVRAQMIAAGWVSEGYGDLGVIMCAPQ